MGIKITRTQDPTRENVGLTLGDLASFLAEAERAGIAEETRVTDCRTRGLKQTLRQISVESD